MKYIRLIFLPLSVLYFVVVMLRNMLYDGGFFRSYAFKTPVIAIGNLSTGGTGKTPQAEYLIRLLKNEYQLATLSRGYKRKSKGYVLGNADSTAAELGDEPFQFHSKFPDIQVAVDANRIHGIGKLLSLAQPPQVIILDDAYQHRRVKAGFYILLTAYNDMYVDDFILPAGNLREGRSGASRADVIIVSKCPAGISRSEMDRITRKLNPTDAQQVFFTCIDYDGRVYNGNTSLSINEIKNKPKMLVAGIAKPRPFFEYLYQEGDIRKEFPDHHEFSEKEIAELQEQGSKNIIITTEKDYMRLKGRIADERLFYLPIQTRFVSRGDVFDQLILDYVGNRTTIR